MKIRKAAEVVSTIFNPSEYSIKKAHKALEQYGGILCLMNDLKTSERFGLCSNNTKDLSEKESVFGKNEQPRGESRIKRYISEERDFIINFLLYLLTLQICIKLLLKRDQLRGIQLRLDPSFDLSIKQEVLSIFLLIIMVFLKALVNLQYFSINKDERKYRNKRFRVRRDGQITELQEKHILVGDILIITGQEKVRVDSIILSCHNMMVSESQTILRQDSKLKNSIWERGEHHTDPFLLAGSDVISGYAELLVCTVGEKCSFRVKRDNQKNFSDSSPLLSKVKKNMDLIEVVSKILALAIATWIALSYVIEQLYATKKGLNIGHLLHVLKIYSAFIGFICILQRLKILRSLYFFLQINLSGSFYRIMKKAAFQKLANLDILFIQASAIDIKKIQVREQIHYNMDHLENLSELNSWFQVKIVGSQKKEQVQQMFEKDVPEEYFYEKDPEEAYRTKVEKLQHVTFLNGVNVEEFAEGYLPIYQGLGYEVGYLSNANNSQNRSIPEQILHISFWKLEGQEKQKERDGRPEAWVILQNKLFMEDIFIQLTQQSFIYAKLFNVYLSLYLNNVLLFMLFLWYSATRHLIGLQWSLMIIIVNRYMFLTVFRRIVFADKPKNRHSISLMEILKINVFLLPYYIFVVSRLQYLNNLFIFFLVNSLFRIESHLFSLQPRRSLKLLATYVVAVGVAYLLNILFLDKNQQQVSQSFDDCRYSIGLLMIFISYVILV